MNWNITYDDLQQLDAERARRESGQFIIKLTTNSKLPVGFAKILTLAEPCFVFVFSAPQM